MMSGNFKTAQINHETMAPGSAETYNSIGVALGEKGDLAAAIDMFEQAVSIRPDYARAWNNLGVALKGLGKVASAIRNFRQAIQIDPEYVEAHWNLSFLLLLTGAFEEGWKEYEWRFRKREWTRNLRGVNGVPRWNGSPFCEKRLLIYGEQGFGDALQFVRYLRMVKGLGGTVILETQQPLSALFRSVPGIDGLIGKGSDARVDAAFDLHMPLLSLPGIFGTTVETIPSQGVVPYIHSDPEKAESWRRRLPGNHFKVGLVWEGKTTDPKRACPLKRLVPLAGIEGVRLYGLQKGEAALQVKELPEEVTVANLGDAFDDFSDTAAAIENLDLVVSVDTAVLHLAGAMGKPTFALLPFAADWRWLLDRDDSPWYPTMRLFRQSTPGDWDDPLKRLISAVSDLAGACSGAGPFNVRSDQEDARADSADASVGINQAVGEAIRFYQSGQPQKSLDICEQVLHRSPGNWEALHLLCIVYHKTGQTDRIIGLTTEASLCRTRTDSLFLSLGNLLKDLGRREEALLYYQEGLRLRPDSPELLYNAGNLLKDQGELGDAVLYYSKAIELKHDMFDAYYNMGNVFNQLGELQKALSCYRKTLEIKPDHIEASHNAGLTLKDVGHFDDAISCYQNALQFKPDAAELHYNLGNVYKEAARFQNAVSCYQKAIDLKHDMVEAHYNMGNALKGSGALDDAIVCYERVLKMVPDHIGAFNNMGLAYRDSGRIDTAMEMFNQALKVRPDHVEIRWNRALALLLRGDLVEGWEEYNVRFERDDLRTTYPRRFAKPLWDGSPFDGKTLLIHHEQGLGDTIQFVRYLPMVKARGGRVVLEVHESLIGLCRGLPGVDEVISRPLDQDLDVAFDCYIPLLTLPGIFNTTLDTIPADIPYLHANPEIETCWQERLDTADLKIGLVWAGNPGHKDDRNRSCPLNLLEPLSRIPGVALYGLQKNWGDQSENQAQTLRIDNLGGLLTDFSITAGVIANLDLIISVDTAVAHLAGAMGKPVWVLLPFVPDWRWLMEREDTPWYPTARLFRHKRPGDWQEVIDRVAAEVGAMAALRSGEGARHRQVEKSGEAASSQARATAPGPLMAEAFQCYQTGDRQRAKDICKKVLAGRPDHAEALHLKGLIHHRAGEYEEAVDLISKAIEIDPNQPLFFNNLGGAYQEKGDPMEAVACYQQAVQLKPDFAEACHNLGKAYLIEKRFEEALLWFEKAVHLGADCREAYPKMSEALLELGRPDEAIACGKRFLDMAPDSANAYFIIGNGFKEQDRFEAAIASYKAALDLNPGHVQALVHMGLAYQLLGRIEYAMESFDRAIAIDNTHAGANLNRALAHLLTGDYAEGWKGYEWRLRMDDWKRRHPRSPDRPRWDGSSFRDATVLVHHEQGLGDALQFVRYLPMVRARGGKVVFEADRRLLRLFKGLAGAEDLAVLSVGRCSEMEAICEIPLLSLPGLFGTTLEKIPSDIPYLRVEADLVDLWARRLSDIQGFRVGISWQGNPSYRDDRHRSAPLKCFMDLTRMEGVTLVSLQKGHGLDQMEHLPNDVSIVNLGPELDNGTDAFVDTAAVMANLDLIVTSDTAIPHLAGALGVPVWLVLPHIPDWRWGLSGETCPWYPSMRIFRQERPNDWPGVFQCVCRSLQERMAD
jgi:tetratricopeptide (TPR) repeat protein